MAQAAATVVDIASLIGKRVSKAVPFLGASITINKLTVAEVQAVQDAAKEAETAAKTAASEGQDEADLDQLGVLRAIIRASVEGGANLTDDAFLNWPIEDISKLAKEIMKYSGIGEDAGKSS